MATNKMSKAARILKAISGRRANNDDGTQEAALISALHMFDHDYYLSQYPDVRNAGIDPVEHYVRNGSQEKRNPAEWFDTAFYLSKNPDVAASGINPFRHFCEFGWSEGRSPSPDFDVERYAADRLAGNLGVGASLSVYLKEKADKEKTVDEWTIMYGVIAESGLFDKDYYLKKYPGVRKAGFDPIEHYLRAGAKELKNPNAFFSTKFYLEKNPDVGRNGMNPLVHYQKYGWRELRDPGPEFDTAWYWLLHMDAALEAGSPLGHYLAVGRAAALPTYSISASAAEKRRISASVARIMESEHLQVRFLTRLADYLIEKKLWDAAELVCRRMVAAEWDVVDHHERLAEVLAAQEKRWQQVGSLRTAIGMSGGNADLYFRLGAAHEAMGRWKDAAEAYTRSLDIDPEKPDAYYRSGYALEKSGDARATALYASAIALSRKKGVERFGVGVLHQSDGRWEDAARAYADKLCEEPLDAYLHFRLGMAQDRCYRWKDAEQSYRVAIALDPAVAYWHYRLGFVRERLHDWLAAAEAYQSALDTSGQEEPYWRYRKAYVLMQAGEDREACRAMLGQEADAEDATCANGSGPNKGMGPLDEVLERIERALEMDFTRADWHYALGMQHERCGRWAQAATSYRAAIDRSDKHEPSWYRRLGLALYRQDEYRAASEVLREIRIQKSPYGVDSSRLEKSPTEMLLLSYNQYIDNLPIRERTILYESYAGVALGCNPLAMFRWIHANPDYADWTHVWVVDDRSRIPDEYRRLRNVIFITRESDLYLRYLATASHLINNSTFPSWFIRRDGQRYLNTWHGTPIKTLGKDIKGNFMERKNTARNFLHATHIISPNPHTTEVLVERYDVSGLLSARVAETGYPRTDGALNAVESGRRRIRERLGLVDGLPVVLYAPTWRGTLGNAVLDFDNLRAAAAGMANLQCQVVFRGHYFSEQQLANADIPVVMAPYGIDTSELLAITDVLVTDYSSILFDFLPMRKPIVYFAYDRDRYSETRGLYFRLQEMPGDLCDSVDDLVAAVSRAIETGRVDEEAYDRAIATFCPHEDGRATERAVSFFMHDNPRAEAYTQDDGRTLLLFYAGAFTPNGITTSFLNLVTALDPSLYRVVIAIDADAVEQSQLRMEKFSKIPSWVQVVARTGRMLASPEERWLISRLRATHVFPEAEMWDTYLKTHEREFRRMFGGARFDGVVQFDGYSPFWSALLLGVGEQATKTMYLHNDMRGEMELKFPSLRGMFKMYDSYDYLVSVSPAMNEVNRENLATAFCIDTRKFTFSENVINPDEILRGSLEELDADLSLWMRGGTVFLTMGRMSPEKDHAKLIRAFKHVSMRSQSVRLVLLGDGPLRGDIEQLIKTMKLEQFVLLAGQRSNPLPALRACDCFVLSSNHEGQPMVLLEAMTLGKPIVATDIDGNRGALMNRGGMLVENSVDGLANGMISFIEGNVDCPRFDAVAYREKAMSHFDRVVVNSDLISAVES